MTLTKKINQGMLQTKPIIVGICGAKFAGKDTSARKLIDEMGFTQVNFADGLRKTMCVALREKDNYFTDPATKEEIDPRSGKSRRYWLQIAGTEWYRSLYDSIWVDWLMAEITDRNLKRVVITDLRFPNELKAIRDKKDTFDSYVIRITNPSLGEPTDSHASESHYKNFDVDFNLFNIGSVENLQEMTKTLVTVHMLRESH
jgi:hypothetical protein